jgi:hypothetical protein
MAFIVRHNFRPKYPERTVNGENIIDNNVPHNCRCEFRDNRYIKITDELQSCTFK